MSVALFALRSFRRKFGNLSPSPGIFLASELRPGPANKITVITLDIEQVEDGVDCSNFSCTCKVRLLMNTYIFLIIRLVNSKDYWSFLIHSAETAINEK